MDDKGTAVNRAASLTILFLLSLPVRGSDGISPREITLRPLTEHFAVLGSANGLSAIEDGKYCIGTVPVTLKNPPESITPVQITNIRFGIAVPIGRNDWKRLATSKYWPINRKLSPAEEVVIDYAFGCMQMPENLSDEKYWLFMEIDFDDEQGRHFSTYSATEEYWQLIDTPTEPAAEASAK